MNSRHSVFVAALLTCCSSYVIADPQVVVIYPEPEQVIHAVDSTFIFGHLNAEATERSLTLEINGCLVEVHRDGGFLAFLPIEPGMFTFEHCLYDDLKLVSWDSVIVSIPEPVHTLSDDTLRIAGDYRPPTGDLVLTTGDILIVSFWGTPGLEAWFTIQGAVDSVPMSETPPRQQPYWGESVFGAGAVPESLLVEGIYTGTCFVPESVSVRNANIVYHLAYPQKRIYSRNIVPPASTIADSTLPVISTEPTDTTTLSSYRVSLNHPGYPFTVRFTDSVQIIRHGPVKGYFSIFQPEGVEALVVGAEGEWYRLRLSHTQFAWAHQASVERLPVGLMPPKSYLCSVRSYGSDESIRIEFPLAGKHPFRIYEDNRRTLRLQLFGVTTDTDWIRYDFSDPLVDIATWSQPEEDLYEFRVNLTQDIWGYDAFYEGNTFCLILNKPPERVHTLWGKTIVIDPGHSADPGAIGPTGHTEAEVNLAIALELERILRRKGADVVMTRRDDSDVPLYDRPSIAVAHDADLFVSIHNNALPDGVNPFVNNGTSSYYYHPHSIELAKAVHAEMIKATGLPDYGLYHGNLAVNRPTQYPAILVECAFMMIPEQEAMLKTDRFRRTLARAVTSGIENFLENYNDGR